MGCKIVALVWLSTALAVPQVLGDELPRPAALAQMESLLDSCSKANPQWVTDYKQQREWLVQGVSDKDLAEVRASDQYKGVYEEISDRFEKAAKAETVKTCRVFLGTAATPAEGTHK